MPTKKRNIDVIGVPVDLGAGRRGVDMGPSAIRVADLEPRLAQLGHKVQDAGDLDVMIAETQKVGEGKRRYKAPIMAFCEELRTAVEKSLERNGHPLVLDGGEEAIRIAGDGTAGIHLSFDLDVVDPEDAPGTGTPVWGGITYREAHLAMEMLSDRAQIVTIDLVEVNPVLDTQNMTGILAAELAQSLLGKRIL